VYQGQHECVSRLKLHVGASKSRSDGKSVSLSASKRSGRDEREELQQSMDECVLSASGGEYFRKYESRLACQIHTRGRRCLVGVM
jgi:hypothetical protein